MDVPPLHKYWGTCPPCPIGIDAPGRIATTIGASTAVMTSEHLIENGDLPSSNSVVY